MKLIVFDLDGTLTATNAVDDECFARALHIVFDIDLINTNWTAYSHVTDAGVMAVAFGQVPRCLRFQDPGIRRVFAVHLDHGTY
jgi:phosphoserine phosphatase